MISSQWFDYSIAARVLAGCTSDPGLIKAAARVAGIASHKDSDESWQSVYSKERHRHGKARAGHYTILVGARND